MTRIVERPTPAAMIEARAEFMRAVEPETEADRQIARAYIDRAEELAELTAKYFKAFDATIAMLVDAGLAQRETYHHATEEAAADRLNSNELVAVFRAALASHKEA